MGELLLGGRYRLEELLGSGGMSVVWQARDEVLGRAVAVKVLHLRDDTARDRIHAEARAAAALSHPNLAQVHDFGDDGFPFLVMELVAGRTLQHHIDEAPLSPAEAFRVCADVCAGLAAAHAAGLVHQDVKPANIMVTENGAKLVDFGLAAPVGPQALEDILGTPAYLAPERLSGHVTPPSDVYALGVLLYRLLAGTLPWTADTTTQLIRDHVFTPPLPLPELPGVPAAVARLCMACLDKEPSGRPSAAAAGVRLAAAATEPPPGVAAGPARVVAGPPAGDGPDPTEPAPASRARRRALAALVLLIAAAGPWLFAAWDGADRPHGSAADATASGGAPSAVSAASGATPAGAAQPGTTQSSAPAGGSAHPGGPQSWDGGPGTSTATTTPPAATRSPAAPPTTAGPITFVTEAGTVQGACAGGGQARVVTSAETKPFKTQSQQNGPAASAYVEFRHGNDLVRMTVTCPSGTPIVDVTRGTR